MSGNELPGYVDLVAGVLPGFDQPILYPDPEVLKVFGVHQRE